MNSVNCVGNIKLLESQEVNDSIGWEINLQSLEDTQVGYISQKYTLEKFTLEKYT